MRLTFRNYLQFIQYLIFASFIFISTQETVAAEADVKETKQCNEPFRPVLADDSPSREYFRQLLQRGISAPLDDFMHLWYPDRKPTGDQDSHFTECKKVKWCKQDTVYSWGPMIKVRAMEENLGDGQTWKGPPNPGHALDTIPSAIGSYAYGPVAVRIKINPDAGVLPPNFETEHIISNAASMESWSYGTPEHYDEIVRDYKRYREHLQAGKFWRGYALQEGNVRPGTSDTPLFNPHELDDHDWSEKTLKASLIEMIKMVLDGKGRIYYSKGTCRNRKAAFETKFPTYINPFLPQGSPGSFKLDSIKNRKTPENGAEIDSFPVEGDAMEHSGFTAQ